jgi:hypothetical protein
MPAGEVHDSSTVLELCVDRLASSLDITLRTVAASCLVFFWVLFLTGGLRGGHGDASTTRSGSGNSPPRGVLPETVKASMHMHVGAGAASFNVTASLLSLHMCRECGTTMILWQQETWAV